MKSYFFLSISSIPYLMLVGSSEKRDGFIEQEFADKLEKVLSSYAQDLTGLKIFDVAMYLPFPFLAYHEESEALVFVKDYEDFLRRGF